MPLLYSGLQPALFLCCTCSPLVCSLPCFSVAPALLWSAACPVSLLHLLYSGLQPTLIPCMHPDLHVSCYAALYAPCSAVWPAALHAPCSAACPASLNATISTLVCNLPCFLVCTLLFMSPALLLCMTLALHPGLLLCMPLLYSLPCCSACIMKRCII